jgi:hypothetical protein
LNHEFVAENTGCKDLTVPMEGLMGVQDSRIMLKQAKRRDEYMKNPQVLDGQRNAIRLVSELNPLSLKASRSMTSTKEDGRL